MNIEIEIASQLNEFCAKKKSECQFSHQLTVEALVVASGFPGV